MKRLYWLTMVWPLLAVPFLHDPTPARGTAAGTTAADTTYGDNRYVALVPGVTDTLTHGSDTLFRFVPDPDSLGTGVAYRAVRKPGGDSFLVISYDTLTVAALDSAAVDSIWSDWGLGTPLAYAVEVPGSPVAWLANEPAGMTEFYSANASDSAGPNRADDQPDVVHDKWGWRGGTTAGRDSAVEFASYFWPIANSPAPVGADSGWVCVFPTNFPTGSGPCLMYYNRSMTVYPRSEYWAMYVYISSNFDFHPTRTKGWWLDQNSNNNHFVYISSDSNKALGLYTQFNDGPPDGLVSANNDYDGMPLDSLKKGEWFLLEFLFVANNPGTKNGKYRAWVDGDLKVSYDTAYYFDTADSLSDYFNARKFNPTWGGGASVVVPDSQFVFFDDWYVSYNASRVSP